MRALILTVFLLVLVVTLREPLLLQVGRVALASQGLHLETLEGVRLASDEIRVSHVLVRSTDRQARYEARHVLLKFSLARRQLERAQIRLLQLTPALNPSPKDESSTSKIILRDVIERWRALPPVQVKITELQLPKAKFALTWRHKTDKDLLKLEHPLGSIRLNTEWLQNVLDINLLVAVGQEPLVSATARAIPLHGSHQDIHQDGYQVSGSAELSAGAALLLATEIVTLPDDMNTAGGSLQLQFEAIFPGNAGNTEFSLTAKSGSTMNSELDSSAGKITAELIVEKPLEVKYLDGQLSAAGGPLDLRLNASEPKIRGNVRVGAIECPRPDHCSAALEISGQSSMLKTEALTLVNFRGEATSALHWQAGTLSLSGGQVIAKADGLKSGKLVAAQPHFTVADVAFDYRVADATLQGVAKSAELNWTQAFGFKGVAGATAPSDLRAKVQVNEIRCTSKDHCDAKLQLLGNVPVFENDAIKVENLQADATGLLRWRTGELALLKGQVNAVADLLTLLENSAEVSDQGEHKAGTPTFVSKPTLNLAGLSLNFFTANSALTATAANTELKWLSIRSAESVLTGSVHLLSTQVTYKDELTLDTTLEARKLRVVYDATPLPVFNASAQIKSAGQKVNVQGKVRGDTQRPLMAFNGQHSLKTERGSATVNSQDWTFGSDGLKAWFNKVPWEAGLRNGSMDVRSQLNWKSDGSAEQLAITGSLTVATNALAGFYQKTLFTGLDLGAEFKLLDGGLVSESPVQLRLELLDAGLPINNISAVGLVDMPAGRYQLLNAGASLLGGELEAGSYVWPSDGEPLDIRFKSLSLTRILSAVDYAPVTGQGELQGSLPLVISRGNLSIAAGDLHAMAPGELRYKPDPALQQKLKSNPQLKVVGEVLENFQYKQLRSSVDYKNGLLNLGLHIEGSNPNVDKGRLVILNLNIEDNLPSLIRSLQAGRSITDMLEERLGR